MRVLVKYSEINEQVNKYLSDTYLTGAADMDKEKAKEILDKINEITKTSKTHGEELKNWSDELVMSLSTSDDKVSLVTKIFTVNTIHHVTERLSEIGIGEVAPLVIGCNETQIFIGDDDETGD